LTLDRLNTLSAEAAEAELLTCCGSKRWAHAMAASRPFKDRETLLATADRVWHGLDPADWLQAFNAHPRIGERGADSSSQQEQTGAYRASADVRAALADGNCAYEERFDHIFLICATGLTAEQMLASLHARLGNDADSELRIAAEEQKKITRIRLERLMNP
jgi:OHCU decarboxylase